MASRISKSSSPIQFYSLEASNELSTCLNSVMAITDGDSFGVYIQDSKSYTGSPQIRLSNKNGVVSSSVSMSKLSDGSLTTAIYGNIPSIPTALKKHGLPLHIEASVGVGDYYSNTLLYVKDTSGTLKISFKNKYNKDNVLYTDIPNFTQSFRVFGYMLHTSPSIQKSIVWDENAPPREYNKRIAKQDDFKVFNLSEHGVDGLLGALTSDTLTINNESYKHDGSFTPIKRRDGLYDVSFSCLNTNDFYLKRF